MRNKGPNTKEALATRKGVDPALWFTGLELGYIVERSDERKGRERTCRKPRPWFEFEKRWPVIPREHPPGRDYTLWEEHDWVTTHPVILHHTEDWDSCPHKGSARGKWHYSLSGV